MVTDTRRFIKEQGDTLIFDLQGFKSETDVSLGDVLSRLPGVEITNDNQIFYQGKRVKQIFIEGRDVLNNQHGLALESLKAEDVEKIQIIHDYKPFHKRFPKNTQKKWL
ncbi:MAG: hypothetical protein HC908_16675 [Calothrix sp. SM1_7_51]|nr:hypothetical protein [Calothrix sp. SM1_7_51]